MNIKKLEKKVPILFVFMIIVIFSIVFVRAVDDYASVIIKLGQISATSETVGLSRSADFTTSAYGDSVGIANVSCMAGWAGWPYTEEGHMTVPAGKVGKLTVNQSRDSNFYIKIFATLVASTHAKGEVKLR
ncbi:MAG: hypothetical protein ACLUVC_10905 [Longibaculum sp.]